MNFSRISDFKVEQSLKKFERLEKKVWKSILNFVDCSKKKYLKKWLVPTKYFFYFWG